MLIAEELFLLLTTDEGKPESAFSKSGFGYVAATITDLVLAQRLEFSDDKRPRVHVVDPSPTDHPILDHALLRLQERAGKRLSSLVTDTKIVRESDIARSLERAGVVDIVEKRMLGFVPERRPVRDPAPERYVRERLRVALVGKEIRPQEATLLAILQGLDLAHKVLREESAGLSKCELKARIKTLTTQVEAGEAVKKAVDAMNAAIAAATVAATSAAGSGSS